MKKSFLLLLLLCGTKILAQNTAPETTKHLLKANLLITPNLEYEQRLTKRMTLGVQLGVELGSIENEVLDETRFVLYPTLNVYSRYYYNFNRRTEKGKNTANNSANYFGLMSSFTNANTILNDPDPRDAYFVTIGGVYGFQRTYWKKLNLGVVFGAGYGFSDVQKTFVPILNFTLGWVLWSQQK